ncbi:MAG: sulfatase [Planctomycetes bacterium]|nr:sulfatase [Planctomycetota bacterium]
MSALRVRSRLACLALLLGGLLATCSRPAADVPPDLYLIVVDTLRADRLGCYGHELPTSPFLDELAAEGTVFLDNTSQSSWTKPSMVSLMSGTYVTSFRDVMPDDVPSLAQTFQQAGYHTIGVVANVLLSPKLGFDRGFDYYDARENTEEELADLEARGIIVTPCREIEAMRAELDRLLDEEFARRDAGAHRPIFAYLHPMEPHDPYEDHPRFAEALPLEGVPTRLPSEWHRAEVESLSRSPESAESKDEWRIMNAHRGFYEREVRATDEALRVFFDRLRAAGRLDNAVIAVVSDHGEGLYEPLAMLRPAARDKAPLVRVFQQGHGRNLNACLVRTPFLLHGAGVPKGVRVDDPVENVDLYPTLVALCGIEPTGTTQGRSLVDLMHGSADEWKRDLHSFTLFATSIRERSTGLKLTLVSHAGRKLSAVPGLYDTVADPDERVNLYDERPDDVARLQQKIELWQAAFPMESSDPASADPEQLRHMRALGYIGND